MLETVIKILETGYLGDFAAFAYGLKNDDNISMAEEAGFAYVINSFILDKVTKIKYTFFGMNSPIRKIWRI